MGADRRRGRLFETSGQVLELNVKNGRKNLIVKIEKNNFDSQIVQGVSMFALARPERVLFCFALLLCGASSPAPTAWPCQPSPFCVAARSDPPPISGFSLVSVPGARMLGRCGWAAVRVGIGCLRGGQAEEGREGARGVKRALEETEEAGSQGTSKFARGIGAGKTARDGVDGGERGAGGGNAAEDRGEVEGPLVEDDAEGEMGGEGGEGRLEVMKGGRRMLEGPETDDAAGALLSPKT